MQKLPNSCVGQDIYGWFDSGPIAGNTIYSSNLAMIHYDTILEIDFKFNSTL